MGSGEKLVGAMNTSVRLQMARIIDECSGGRYNFNQIIHTFDRGDLRQKYNVLKNRQLKDLDDEEKLIMAVCIATGIGKEGECDHGQ